MRFFCTLLLLSMSVLPLAAQDFPEELAKLVQDLEKTNDAAPMLHRFYQELRAAGIDVLDLEPVFGANEEDNRYPVYCRTDSHWSGTGCVLAARTISDKLRRKITAPTPAMEFVSEWKEVQITGDL